MMNKEELQQCAAAKSDQIDADNLIGGITMDVTIKAVQRGPSNEQPLQLVLEETDKFYRPSKTYRRALIGCFGDEPANWIGKRLRLVRNPDTMFGGVKVGGLEVSPASIAAPVGCMLSATRGKKAQVSIDVIPAAKKVPAAPTPKPLPEASTPKHAKGTISGDPAEGDLSGIAEPPPAADKPDGATLSQVINAFATKLNMTAPMIEAEYDKRMAIKLMNPEYSKPMAEWTNADVAEARELFKHLLHGRNTAADDRNEV